MSKVRLLTITSIGLLVCNIVLLAFMFFGKPPHTNHEGPKQLVIEKLGFNDTQVAEYDLLIETHKTSISSYDNELKQLKQNLYVLLSKESSDLERNEMIQKINNLQKDIELTHYHHFEQIKSLCKDDQIEKFNELSKDLSKMFAPKGPHK